MFQEPKTRPEPRCCTADPKPSSTSPRAVANIMDPCALSQMGAGPQVLRILLGPWGRILPVSALQPKMVRSIVASLTSSAQRHGNCLMVLKYSKWTTTADSLDRNQHGVFTFLHPTDDTPGTTASQWRFPNQAFVFGVGV